MASNFQISVHRNSDNLHLKLIGDFDRSSADQLLNILRKNVKRTYKIFIHTNNLKQIHPFGYNLFHNNINVLKNGSDCLVFTGDKADKIAPI